MVEIRVDGKTHELTEDAWRVMLDCVLWIGGDAYRLFGGRHSGEDIERAILLSADLWPTGRPAPLQATEAG